MSHYYCPACWTDSPKDIVRCPNCGLDIRAFFRDKDYVDKLSVALGHPEPTTPVRAAWILGERRERRAVQALMDLCRRSGDVFIVRAAVEALIRIGTPQALSFVESLAQRTAIALPGQEGRGETNEDEKPVPAHHEVRNATGSHC